MNYPDVTFEAPHFEILPLPHEEFATELDPNPVVAHYRAELAILFVEVARAATGIDGAINSSKEIDSLMRDIPGYTDGQIEILSPPDHARNMGYSCAEFAFGTAREESWAQEGSIAAHYPSFWKTPLTFLAKKGYSLTTSPTHGCIVAYGKPLPGKIDRDQIWLEHFGIYNDDDLPYVISKFGLGPICRHPLNLVPGSWGNRYYFLEKM